MILSLVLKYARAAGNFLRFDVVNYILTIFLCHIYPNNLSKFVNKIYPLSGSVQKKFTYDEKKFTYADSKFSAICKFFLKNLPIYVNKFTLLRGSFGHGGHPSSSSRKVPGRRSESSAKVCQPFMISGLRRSRLEGSRAEFGCLRSRNGRFENLRTDFPRK